MCNEPREHKHFSFQINTARVGVSGSPFDGGRLAGPSALMILDDYTPLSCFHPPLPRRPRPLLLQLRRVLPRILGELRQEFLFSACSMRTCV